MTPMYQIFSGPDYKHALRMDAVEEFGCAFERMRELATKKPGPYFVFCPSSRAVVATIDTTKREFRGRISE